MSLWNPWHGCHKISPGCQHCYVYRSDARYGRDASHVTKNQDFNLPIKKKRDGEYKLPAGETVYTCFTSDFFLEDADEWRIEAWQMIRVRRDLNFFIVTKRIDRFEVNLPHDWGGGYENVSICSTCENQDRADYRLPIFLALPIRHKSIICEPLLGPIHLSPYLGDAIDNVTVGGESGDEARICDYAWVLDIRQQCLDKGVSFHFKQTGARFVKDGKLYHIQRKYQHSQAIKANIDI
jgi:protein gp37